nr:hypothetical protein [Rhodococcus fascians]
MTDVRVQLRHPGDEGIDTGALAGGELELVDPGCFGVRGVQQIPSIGIVGEDGDRGSVHAGVGHTPHADSCNPL